MFGFFNKKVKLKNDIQTDKENNLIPKHIAIIMDGNGRWAKRRGLPRNFGHKEGANNLKKVVEWCDDLGVEHVTVYAFSTENWKRPQNEVESLMQLLLEFLKNAEREMGNKSVCIDVIGDKKGLPDEIQQEIIRVEGITKKNKAIKLHIALNYGSRDEIVNSFKDLLKRVNNREINIDEISDSTINESLYTKGIPDPDLLIRTGGEMRISNFLLWQCAYSEFWFTDVFWPDFKKANLLDAIKEYQNRNRRFGGI